MQLQNGTTLKVIGSVLSTLLLALSLDAMAQAEDVTPLSAAETSDTQALDNYEVIKPNAKSKQPKTDKEKNPQKNQQRKGPAQPAPPDIPAHDISLILGRPTDDSITMSIMRHDQAKDLTVTIGKTPTQQPISFLMAGVELGAPQELLIKELTNNTQYFFDVKDSASQSLLYQGSFHTQRSVDSEFVFTVTADSHLDNNAAVPLYLQTLANIKDDKPDFHIDLGDTFMTGKHQNRDNAYKQYLAQRYFFSQMQAPLFLVLGNHDGEENKLRKGGSDSLAHWSVNNRTRYFPNPEPNTFYSGNDQPVTGLGYLQDYYAWEWGNTLFVTLNPYWNADSNKQQGSWAPSLGDAQYQWLKQTLEQSTATHKLVFIHQLVGGLEKDGRGGVAAVPYGEWGGHSASGKFEFAEKRHDWPTPIHQLLVNNKVSAVFHGHDHLFSYEQLDGIVYQLVPQPAHLSFAPPRDAEAYGYASGTILGGSGHMRISVSKTQMIAEFVRTDVPRKNNASDHNGEVLYRYTIAAK